MKSYVPYTICCFSSVSDCQMILDELKDDLQEVSLSNEQLQAIVEVLNNKKGEVTSRYRK
ncbi:hypothetical protein [Rummeliibacillus sp. POC4]|uniref:hypothetical protein n=1 Tax=Rummeliibacillus sp. POC4 TaxID=2305899 RepID=UPI000E66729C|nr:hypothetical protein [Rummeliibacillus sp. POC4]RIJ65320.1 hypothetical protein D1606_08335 [Rummeliibacillus sp. POC4]